MTPTRVPLDGPMGPAGKDGRNTMSVKQFILGIVVATIISATVSTVTAIALLVWLAGAA